MHYRVATDDDIEMLCECREKQLIDEGQVPETGIRSQLRTYFAQNLGNDSLIEWVAEEEGRIVGTAAIILYEFPPSFKNRSGLRGYINNVYTERRYRKKGIATKLLDKVVAEARQRGVTRIWLETSAMGFGLYRKYGFLKSEEDMYIDL